MKITWDQAEEILQLAFTSDTSIADATQRINEWISTALSHGEAIGWEKGMKSAIELLSKEGEHYAPLGVTQATIKTCIAKLETAIENKKSQPDSPSEINSA